MGYRETKLARSLAPRRAQSVASVMLMSSGDQAL